MRSSTLLLGTFLSNDGAYYADDSSVGFFLDSYDLFIVNLVTPVWTFE